MSAKFIVDVKNSFYFFVLLTTLFIGQGIAYSDGGPLTPKFINGKYNPPFGGTTKKESIIKLNCNSNTQGINYLNGGLVLVENDLSVMGRTMSVTATRFYNSKGVWGYAIDNYGDSTQHLKVSGNMGLGWDFHFGKRVLEGDVYTFKYPDGTECHLQYIGNSTYISTDNQYFMMKGNTLYVKNGTRIIFNDTLVSEIIDLNGNTCKYFWSTKAYKAVPDSAYSSSGLAMYVYSSLKTGDMFEGYLIDSIKTKGYLNQDYTVKYHYSDVAITAGPLKSGTFWDDDLGVDGVDSTDKYLLKSVVWPNNDSVSYGYNNMGELTTVNNQLGGQTSYGYGIYSFSVPEQDNPWVPTDTIYTRSVDTVKVKDSPSGSDITTIYTRYYDTRQSNPEYCKITDPYGNDQVYYFMRSGWIGGITYKFLQGYGTKYKEVRYSGLMASGSVIDSAKYAYTSDDPAEPYWGTNVRMDSIVTVKGSKVYCTKYRNYDSYGNPGRIESLGDIAISWDDKYSYTKYLHDSYIITVQVSALSQAKTGSNVTISIPYSSNTAVNRTTLMLDDNEIDVQNFSPSTSGTRTYIWSTSGLSEGNYYFKATAYDVAGNASLSGTICIYVCPDAIANPPTTTSSEVSSLCNSYDEAHNHILDRVIRQYDSTSAEGMLNEVIYRYDDYQNIDSTLYASYPPAAWENPHQDPRGLITAIKRWTGDDDYDSTRMFYDQCGNLIKTINANGDSSKADYMVSGDPDRYQYGLPYRSINYVGNDSLVTKAEYDSCSGLITKSIGVNSDTTRFTYDIMGRSIKTYSAAYDSAVTVRHYYSGSYPTAVIDSVMLKRTPLTYLVKKTFINGMGLVIQSQKQDSSTGYSIIVNTAYDSLGRVRKVSNPFKTTTSFGTFVTTDYWSSKPKIQYYYDAISHPIKTIFQDGNRDSVSYVDNVITTYDALNHSGVAVINSFGSPDTVIDGLGNMTLYNYDKMGRTTSVVDAEGKTSYTYCDKLGRAKGYNIPDASSSYSYEGNSVDALLEYDNIGNVTANKNSKAEVYYNYDDLSRVTEVDSASSSYPRVKYLYDSYSGSGYSTPPDSLNNPKGRLTRLITVGVDTTWYVYDKIGRVKKKIYTYAGMTGGRDSMIFNYNAVGACTLMTYPDGSTIKYGINSMGRLYETSGFISGVTYNDADQPLSIYHSSYNMTDVFTYDNCLRPSYVTARDNNTVYKLKLLYTYWQNGHIKKIQDYVNSNYTHYYDYTSPDSSYDALGRLQRCAVGSTVLTYSYDDVGNRTQEVIGGTTNSISYTSGTNKISSATVSGTTYSYTYDNSGNVIRKNWGASNQDDFYYNYANMLAQAVLDGGRTVTNYYGSGGSLKVKKTDSQTGSRYYAYNGIDPLCEYDSTGTIKRKYVYAMGKCVGMIDSAGNRYLCHHDALGSIRVVVDTTGTVVNNYAYYPFGDSLTYSGTTNNDLKFTSKSYIEGMKAYDFSARYYDPAIGRFYSIDPLNDPATSPYAYCNNNPVNTIDPSGMRGYEPYVRHMQNDLANLIDGQSLALPNTMNCNKDPLADTWGLVGSGNGQGYDPFYGAYTDYEDYWKGPICGGSGGYLTNNGVWVSGLEMADGKRFNTWYSNQWNYGRAIGMSDNVIQNIAVIVNILSSDYFDNVGQFIQENGIMMKFDKDYKGTGYVDPKNTTVINLGYDSYYNDALTNDFLSATPTGTYQSGVLNMARTIGHEAIHTIQFNAGWKYDSRSAINVWRFECPATSYGREISSLLGEPLIPLPKFPGWR